MQVSSRNANYCDTYFQTHRNEENDIFVGADEEQERRIERRLDNQNTSRVRFTKKYRKRAAEDANLSAAVTSLANSLCAPTNEEAQLTSRQEPKKDKFDKFGELIAEKMRALTSQMYQLRAERDINNILFDYAVKDAGLDDGEYECIPVFPQ